MQHAVGLVTVRIQGPKSSKDCRTKSTVFVRLSLLILMVTELMLVRYFSLFRDNMKNFSLSDSTTFYMASSFSASEAVS